MKRQFDLSIDHAMLKAPKLAFDECLKRAIAKAISTGSYEGSASLKISFEIFQVTDSATGEMMQKPILKYKAGYTVPQKEGIDGTIAEESRLELAGDEWKLINSQILIDELMEGENETDD